MGLNNGGWETIARFDNSVSKEVSPGIIFN